MSAKHWLRYLTKLRTSKRLLLLSLFVTLFAAPTGVAFADSVPATPSGINANATSPTSVFVTWADNATNETGYLISNGVDGQYLNSNTTSFTWGGLAPNTYMCFAVIAYNATGYSDWTPWGCTTTPNAVTIPTAPSGITATAVSSSSIQVHWYDNSSNETGFKLSNGVSTVTLGAGTTSYTWSGLAPNTYMCFYAYAYNSAGTSSTTGWGCTTTPNNVTIPTAPSGITATASGQNSIVVHWNDNSSNETGFKLSNGVTTVTLGAGTTSYTWSGLAPGTYMCSYVYAYNSAGNSSATSQACTSTQNVTIPTAPSGISAVASSSNSIVVHWYDNSNNESGFKISNGVNYVNVGANTTSYTWSGLAPGTYMCFSASAYNAAGTSAGTGWGCTTTPASSTRETKAMNWARSVLGQAYTNGDLGDSNHPWNGWCDNFVAHAYGRSSSGYATAIAHFNNLKSRGLIHTTGTPPNGALVFFAAASINGYAGHVMLSEGNGNYITSAATIRRVNISWPGAPYIGWSYANPEWAGR